MAPKKEPPSVLKRKHHTRWSKKPSSGNADAYFRRLLWDSSGRGRSLRPRCHTCRVNRLAAPSTSRRIQGRAQVDGTEGVDVVPCGHDFKAAILEEWMLQVGLLDNPDHPKTLGNYGPLFVGLIEKLLNVEVTPELLVEKDANEIRSLMTSFKQLWNSGGVAGEDDGDDVADEGEGEGDEVADEDKGVGDDVAEYTGYKNSSDDEDDGGPGPSSHPYYSNKTIPGY